MPTEQPRSVQFPSINRALSVVRWMLVVVVFGALALINPPAALRAGAQGGTIVKVDPASSTVDCGQTIVVNIRIENASNLAGAEVHLTYDPFLLEAQIEPGGFPAPDFVLQSSATGGRIDFAITQIPQQRPPVSGSGDLLRITFKGLAPGTSAVNFTSALLSDGEGVLIASTTQNGSVSVCPPTPTPTFTPTPTHTPTSTPTPTPTPTPTFTPIPGIARVKVSPPSSTVAVSNTAVVGIQIEGAENLWGVDLKLTYDPAIVQCTQSQPGAIPVPDVVAKNVCAGGAAEYIASQQAPRPPARGTGDAMRLTFHCLKAGISQLRLERSTLVDRDGRALPKTATDGQITCAAPPDGGPILGSHTVRAGETLFCIGRAYRVLPSAIASTNGISAPYRLFVGQVLKIPNVPWTNIPPGPTCARQFDGTPPPPPPPQPCRALYTVVRGDTLLGIARRFGVNVFTLAARNSIFNLNLIYVGQVLCIL